MPLETLDKHGDAFAVAAAVCDLLSEALSPRAVRLVDVASDACSIAIEGDDGADWMLTIRAPESE